MIKLVNGPRMGFFPGRKIDFPPAEEEVSKPLILNQRKAATERLKGMRKSDVVFVHHINQQMLIPPGVGT